MTCGSGIEEQVIVTWLWSQELISINVHVGQMVFIVWLGGDGVPNGGDLAASRCNCGLLSVVARLDDAETLMGTV